MREEREIKICSRHRDKEETPLIWTFAFNGAEYWCPYCGVNEGMLGAGENVEWTQELQDRHDKYKKESKNFLHARSAIVCSSITINGENRTFDSLPSQTQSYYRNMANSWKYKK